MIKTILFAAIVIPLIAYVCYNLLYPEIIDRANVESCPFCFGTDFCANLTSAENDIVHNNTPEQFFIRQFGVKNAYKVQINGQALVLKKLAHDAEFRQLDEKVCSLSKSKRSCNIAKDAEIHISQQDLIELIMTTESAVVKSLMVCYEDVGKSLIEDALTLVHNQNPQEYLIKLWTSISVNFEGVLMQLLHQNSARDWPIPWYFGACGRMIVVNDCGENLNNFATTDWKLRAKLALQLIEAANMFTTGHEKYRIYLTDLSPDNIAVNSEGQLFFVDLENVIITLQQPGNNSSHISIDYDDGESVFVYSEKRICEREISDHNIYAVFKLLLSPKSPWPMMSGGLLHSPPANIANKLTDLLNDCVKVRDVNRFEVATQIQNLLKTVV